MRMISGRDARLANKDVFVINSANYLIYTGTILVLARYSNFALRIISATTLIVAASAGLCRT
jgi:hypothetical protein